MKKTAVILLGLFCLRLPAAELAVPATPTLSSPKSVHHLLDVMQAHRAIDAIMDQLDKAADQIAAAAMQGRNLSAADQTAVVAMTRQAFRSVREEFSWNKMEQLYIQVYSETFTEDEIAGMTAFYSTPSGQSVMQKLPAVMQRTMTLLMPMLRGKVEQTQADVTKYVTTLAAKHPGKTG